jgi:predicted nucleic acid-binding protein
VNIFVDTSALYSLLDADDGNHKASAATWRELMKSNRNIVTTNYVLLETFALIQNRLGLGAARRFQEDVVPVLSVEFVTPEMHRLGMAALLAASKRSLSLVDCVSFETMRDLGIRSVFAFDAHFQEYGFMSIT